jgi:hypothetical protein
MRGVRGRLAGAVPGVALALVLGLAPGAQAAPVAGGTAARAALARVGEVGPLARAGAAEPLGCSGVLAAPDRVLTAAHCVADPATGVAVAPATLAFRTADGRVVGVTGITLPPDRGILGGGLRYDVAVLTLAAPVAAPPLALGFGTAAPGAVVMTVGIPRGAGPARAVVARDCAVVSVAGPVIGLTCGAVSGQSGGAVIAALPKGPALVGIIVARTREGGGPVGSYAVIPDPGVLLPPR